MYWDLPFPLLRKQREGHDVFRQNNLFLARSGLVKRRPRCLLGHHVAFKLLIPNFEVLHKPDKETQPTDETYNAYGIAR